MVKNNIKEVRTNKNIRQSELAIGSGCCKQTISRYETGERQPCLETALRIARYLNVSTDELFEVDALPGIQ